MKKLTLILFAFYGTVVNGQTLEWTQPFIPSPLDSIVNMGDMGIDNEGNIIVAGVVAHKTNSNYLDSISYLIVKYAQNGNLMWEQRLTGSFVQIHSMEIDEWDNIYITGVTNSGCTTIMFDSDGVEQWFSLCNNGYLTPRDMVLDQNQNVYVTGFLTDSLVTVKYNSVGEEQWSMTEFGNVGDSKRYIAVDANSNVYVAHRGLDSVWNCITIKYNAQGVKQWEKTYHGHYGQGAMPAGLEIDLQGNPILLAASKYNTSHDFSIVKSAPNGITLFEYSYFYDSIYHAAFPKVLALDNEGNIYAAGGIWYGGCTIDAFCTIKVSNSGDLEWAKTFNNGGCPHDVSHDISIDQFGNVFVTGESGLDIEPRHKDIQTLAYDSEGNLIWENLIVDEQHQYGVSVENYPDGSVYVLGNGKTTTGLNYVLIKYSHEPESVDERSKDELIVYPNPTNSFITIQTEIEFTDAWLTDLAGRRLMSFQPLDQKWQANLSNVPSGFFLVEAITTDKTRLVIKVIKE